MKSLALALLLGLFFFQAYSQNIIATTSAVLRVYALMPDGKQAVITSQNLYVSYDQLKMTGELMLNTLSTDDEALRKLLDSASYDRITFSGVIPEGQFAFQSMLNSRFSVETELFYSEYQSKILIDFDVSNRNTSLANTFDITCTGNISMRDDLGIDRELGLDDKVSFQFFQNVTVKNY